MDYISIVIAIPAEVFNAHYPIDAEIFTSQTLLIPSTEQFPGVTSIIEAIKLHTGKNSLNVLQFEDIESMILNLELGENIAILPSLYTQMLPEGIKVANMSILPNVPLVATWLVSSRNPNIARFITLLKGISPSIHS